MKNDPFRQSPSRVTHPDAATHKPHILICDISKISKCICETHKSSLLVLNKVSILFSQVYRTLHRGGHIVQDLTKHVTVGLSSNETKFTEHFSIQKRACQS